MIVLKDSLQVIGNCSLTSPIIGSRQSQIGWHLSHAYRGQGLITETATCLLELGFQEHRVEAIRADSFPDNRASLRVMEKIGMQKTQSGFLMRWVRAIKYGERRTIVRYQIKKQDWLARTELAHSNGK